ncbi:MAG TPA: efflux RND transporter periplasmic adaptor subunit, partial [Bryobacteraceae bacterium]|nr:efflux RND transporter periplasmic adaptor subunit [Bryobacteraceae bacterium]
DFARRQVSLLQAQANLASAQANLVKARQDYDRLVPMVQADAASKQDLDGATAALKANEANVNALQANVDQTSLSTSTQIDAMQGKVESLKAALRTAELNLQYATITAPVSGRIGDTLIPVGGLVTPNSAQPLTTIVPLDPIWVRFKVSESDYLSWSTKGKGMWHGELRLTLADNCELPARGRVEDSLNQFDPKTGTLELQASFPNPQRTVLPGQFGRVRVEVEQRRDAIVIPQRAVQQLQGIQMVYIVGPDNRVVQQAITTGPRVGDGWVVERGLKPGDRIVVDGLLRVRPGTPVKAVPYQTSVSSGGPAPGN